MLVKDLIKLYENHINLILLERNLMIDEMFPKTLLELVDKHKPGGYTKQRLNNDIEEIRKSLKRKDRIVWLLRILRLSVMNYLIIKKGQLTPEVVAYIENELKKFNKKAKKNFTWNDIKSLPKLSNIIDTLEHFYSMNIPKIEKYVFKYETPKEIYDIFSEIEEGYKSSIGADDELILENPDEEVFLKIDNTFTWFNLNRASCSDEAAAMGHCGNAPSSHNRNQTILSLRQKIVRGKTVYWRPVLTFIYHIAEKGLGEMKGRGNEKPAKRYHPHIIKLLRDNRIQKIIGGGYLSDNNFSVNDLDEKVKERLLAVKPALMSFMDILKNGNLELAKERFIESNYVVSGSDVIIDTSANLVDLIEDFGDESAKQYAGYLTGEEYIEYDISDYNEYIKNQLTSEQKEELIKYTKNELLIDDDDDLDISEALDMLESDSADIYYELSAAIRYGYESGTMDEIHNAYKNALNNTDEYEIEGFDIIQTGNFFDDKYHLLVDFLNSDIISEVSGEGVNDPDTFVEAVKEILNYNGGILKLEVPYYGFSGFDEEVTKQHIAEAINNIKD